MMARERCNVGVFKSLGENTRVHVGMFSTGGCLVYCVYFNFSCTANNLAFVFAC